MRIARSTVTCVGEKIFLEQNSRDATGFVWVGSDCVRLDPDVSLKRSLPSDGGMLLYTLLKSVCRCYARVFSEGF